MKDTYTSFSKHLKVPNLKKIWQDVSALQRNDYTYSLLINGWSRSGV